MLPDFVAELVSRGRFGVLMFLASFSGVPDLFPGIDVPPRQWITGASQGFKGVHKIH